MTGLMGRRKQTDTDLPPRLRLKHGAYYYVRRVEGVERWTHLGCELEAALARWRILDNPAPEAWTVGAAMTRYAAECVPQLAPATRREYARYLDILRPVFGHCRLIDVERRHVAQYVDMRSAKIQANREVACLSSVFRESIRWGWCNENPARGSPKNKERRRMRLPSEAELAAIRLAAGPQLRAMLDVTLLTGLRKSDLLGLRLSDLTDDGIRLTVSKTGRPILFSWTPALRETVDSARALPRRVGSLYLFANRRGQAIKASGLDSTWDKAKAKAGVEGLTWHDLRRWAITQAQQSGGLDYAQALGAHRSRQATERYVVEQPLVIRPLR
jgi:integrase